MLDSLDTLIAFVLIMLAVSLLITIAVQMCAAALNLRGQNLLSGLTSTFAVINPGIEKDKKELARYLLKGGLLSDSFLPNSFLQKWKNNPVVSKLVAGVNYWRHSSAIRPDELFDAIHRIAIAKEPADANLSANARSLLYALGVSETTLNEAEGEIKDAQAKANQISDEAKRALDADFSEGVRKALDKLTLGDDMKSQMLKSVEDGLKSRSQQLEAAFQDQIKTITDQVKAYGNDVAVRVVAAAGTIDAAYEKFHYWTCIAEERAQQWLTMHTRILTVIFAFIFAFALQLDTVEIFKLVASNKTVRDKLVAQAGVAETQAANVLGDNNSVLKSALKDWSDKQTDSALKDVLAKIDIQPGDTREIVRKKVDAALKDKAQPVGTFDSSVKDVVTKKLDKKAGDFKEVKADLDKTGFQLFPDSKNGRWGRGQGLWLAWWNGSRGHHWGILFSVALLSLGAPFWYHALKDLVSLRSQVAQNIAEQKDEPGVAAPSAPPTVKPPDDTQAKQAAMLTAAREKFEVLRGAQTDPTKLSTAIADLDSTLNPKTSS
jgi:hypothetical protein